MSKHLGRDLELLERQLLTQGSVVEQMIRTATRSLCERKFDLVWEVMEKEQEVNAREVAIEEESLKIMALHQPVAIDLRRTAAILKINSDLERIADLAVNVAERSRAIAEQPEIPVSDDLETMANISVEMVSAALDAFVELDVDQAQQVCLRDDQVDELNVRLIEEVHNVMRSDSRLIEAALFFFSATRHLERIADHATNIAEDVIYLVEGEITRHRHEDVRRNTPSD